MSHEAEQLYLSGVFVEPVSPENFKAASIAANADGHATIMITDVVKKGPDVIGHISIGGANHVLVWLDTKKCQVRDAWFVARYIESICKREKHKFIIMPCVEESPLLPILEKIGYKKAAQKLTIFTKEL